MLWLSVTVFWLLSQELLVLKQLNVVDIPSFPLHDSALQFEFTWENMAQLDRPTPLVFEQFQTVLKATASVREFAGCVHRLWLSSLVACCVVQVYDILELAMTSFSDAKSRCDMLLKDPALTTLPLELARPHITAFQRVSVVLYRHTS